MKSWQLERDAMAINADLGEALERFVTELVGSGLYESESDVLREGVRLLQERERRLAELDASIARGLADVEAGRTIPIDEVFDALRARLEEKAKA
jgi:antitoxin ParD1/3/4